MERMAKARMKRLNSTTTPPRSSVQVRALDLFIGGSLSGKELTYVGVPRGLELAGRALEMHLALPQHQELGAGQEGRVLEPAEDELPVLAEDEGARHVEGVAQLVGDQDRGHPVQV